MPLQYLFLDLNSYFASVEQQDDPSLRGRPVAVCPLDTPSGCCIAVSVEAKRFGVKTGMRVYEARRLCPELLVAPSRPRRYVEMHHAVVAAVDTCIPITQVQSIDEMVCRLAPDERTPEAATKLASRVKSAVRDLAGDWMRCSIGIAPNRFLSKVASDMQKPDGLVVIRDEDLPDRLLELELQDLPGIGPKMYKRLCAGGVDSVALLVSMSEDEMGSLWGSVVGRRWWHLLRGRDLYEPPTHRRSIGHQHVLGPQRRTDHGAWEVAARLLHKAASRARHLGYWARRMSLGVRSKGSSWHETAGFPGGTQDTAAMLHALGRLWRQRPDTVPVMVDVTLCELSNGCSTTLPLFEQERKLTGLSHVMDRVNEKFGANTVYLAPMHDARTSAPGGIAFRSIPDLAFVDTVRARQREPD